MLHCMPLSDRNVTGCGLTDHIDCTSEKVVPSVPDCDIGAHLSLSEVREWLQCHIFAHGRCNTAVFSAVCLEALINDECAGRGGPEHRAL